MESKAQYLLIGSFVIVALLMAIAFVAWLSNAQFDQEFDTYEVVFTGPARGISRGSEVHYNGLPVGEVTRLRWSEEESNIVIADVQIIQNTPVHQDSIAQLEPQGLTGLNYLQITPGPGRQIFSGRRPYQIEGKMSQIESILDDGGSIIDSTQRALNRVNATLDEQAIKDFHKILSNIRDLTGKLNDTDISTEQIAAVLAAFEQAAKDVSTAAIATEKAAVDFDMLVQNDVKTMIPRLHESLAHIDGMLMDISKFAQGGEALTVDARDAINRLSNSGLTDMEETADGIRRLIINLNEVVEKLEENPSLFIAGEDKEVMELPQ